MLEIGNGGMSNIEYRTHMTLWAVLAAPLLAGNDPRSMTPEIRDILTNREVVAIDQDRLGHQGAKALQMATVEAWTRPLEDTSTAIAVFNRGNNPQHVSLTWSELGVKVPAHLRDPWSHTDLPVNAAGIEADIPSHGSVLLRAE
jgi:alpha-galactosidase